MNASIPPGGPAPALSDEAVAPSRPCPGRGETTVPIRKRGPLGTCGAPAPPRERGAHPIRAPPAPPSTPNRPPPPRRETETTAPRRPRSPRLPSAPPAAPPPARPRAAAAARPAPPSEAREPRAPPPPAKPFGAAAPTCASSQGGSHGSSPRPGGGGGSRQRPRAAPRGGEERGGGRGRARIQRPEAPPPAAPPHAPTTGEQQTTTTWRPPPPPSLSPPPPRCIMGWRRTRPSLAGRAASGRRWLVSQGPGAPRAGHRQRTLRMRPRASARRGWPAGPGWAGVRMCRSVARAAAEGRGCACAPGRGGARPAGGMAAGPLPAWGPSGLGSAAALRKGCGAVSECFRALPGVPGPSRPLGGEQALRP